MFGGGKKSYRELPVYGWVTRKPDGALRKRPGDAPWLEQEAGRWEFVLEL